MYQVSETKPHGTLFDESLYPETTGSKVPTEDGYSGPSTPTGEISFVDGNESDELHNSHENGSAEPEKPKTPMDGQGQGASATASKEPLGCYRPPGILSTPLDHKASGYGGHFGAGDYSFPESNVGEGQGQGASATASKGPQGCYHPPGVFSSKPTSQKASGYSDHVMPANISLPELMQVAAALGMNFESSALQQPDHQMELLKKLLALQESVGDAQGSSTYNAAAADSPSTSNCYSKAGYSVVITHGHLCESTSEKGVVVMESGTQFCILIANNNNYGE